MIFHSFLDDSKDQNQSKLMVSAGFYATKEIWGSFRSEWAKVLAANNLEYFKSSEYKRLEGQFARFKTGAYPPPEGREAARAIRNQLQLVLEHHPGIRGVGATVLLEEYKKVMARPEAEGMLYTNPYHAALVSVMFETINLIRRIPGNNMVAFVHDKQDDFPELHAIYQGFKATNPKSAKLCGGFEPRDDKLHAPLQVADMIANYTLRLSFGALQTGDLKANLKEMKKNINLLGVWTEDYILSALKHELTRKGKPIPLDLAPDQYG